MPLAIKFTFAYIVYIRLLNMAVGEKRITPEAMPFCSGMKRFSSSAVAAAAVALVGCAVASFQNNFNAH